MTTDADTARPWGAGYALSLYDHFRWAIPELRDAITCTEAALERERTHLEKLKRDLAEAESTLVWMQQHQADEIAKLEAERSAVRARLRAAGWDLPESGPAGAAR